MSGLQEAHNVHGWRHFAGSPICDLPRVVGSEINMLTFETKQVIEQIDPLPKRLRVAFAAACAQRQLPNYVRTSAANPTGSPKAVTRMLRELWDAIARDAF